ncbi:MAG: hypothetical protein ABWZ40_10240, partial [Caulobacterales bacterium]
MRSALLPQRLIAAPFLILGAWCVVAPGSVERLGLRPEAVVDNPTSHLLMACFGAQAILSGLFAFFSRFTRTTFLVYGIALLPFFWFNYYFVFVQPIFNHWMALDFGSNLFMLACCVWGWKRTEPSWRHSRQSLSNIVPEARANAAAFLNTVGKPAFDRSFKSALGASFGMRPCARHTCSRNS